MLSPPLPVDESGRLHALAALHVLDSPEEPDFDHVLALIARVCQTPIALISLVDHYRQWFKARIGMDTPEVPRKDSFCAYTILSDELMEVADTQHDPRFADNPLVKYEPRIRFYAGFPLTTSTGFNVGALCVADQKPRALSATQKFALSTLATEVMQRLELRANNLHLRTSLSLVNKISPTGTFTVYLSTNRITLTPNLKKAFGLSDSQVSFPTSDVSSLVHSDDLAEIRTYMSSRSAYENSFRFDFRAVHPATTEVLYFVCCGDIMRDTQGRPYQLVGAIRNATDERKKEELAKQQNLRIDKVNAELDHLVYRISHDLRAPIATALGLLYLAQQEEKTVAVQPFLKLTEDTLRKQDQFISDILTYAQNSRTDITQSTIAVKPLIAQMVEQHRSANSPVVVFISVQQPVVFISDEFRIETILSKLISNAFRYAKPQRARPYINIEAKITRESLQLQVEDNGIGIGHEHVEHIFKMFYRATEYNPGSGIGLYIAKETAEKLSGSITVRSVRGTVTVFSVTIPNMLAS